MPNYAKAATSTPALVSSALQAFGSDLRVHLIRFYAASPSRQADAVRALGVERRVVQFNTTILAEVGVLSRHPDRGYSVDRDRVRELLRALEEFELPTED